MENSQVCLTLAPQLVGYFTLLVTVASGMANFIKPDSPLGKLVHFAAFNFRVSKTQPTIATSPDNQNQPTKG